MLDHPTPCFSVFGAGSWGTALAILLTRNAPTIRIWGRNNTETLHKDRINSRYLPGIRLPDSLRIENEFSKLIHTDLCFLIVTPSHAFRETLQHLYSAIIAKGFDPKDATILWGTKGLDPQTGGLLSDVANEIFPKTTTLGCISGPSFAAETAKGLPTALTLACDNQDHAQALAHCFRTETTRVYYNHDLIGVQIGAAIKNVMAIATGISDGLGYGANARAALITRGLAEVIRLGVAVGGKVETFNGLSGLGDLILTCTDNQSRNRRFGLGIGAGKSKDEMTHEIGQEIEGIQTTLLAHRMAHEYSVEMPITEQVFQVLYENKAADVAVQSLLEREPRAENS